MTLKISILNGRRTLLDRFFKYLFPNTRLLSEDEQGEIRLVYGDMLQYDKILVDENSILAKMGAFFKLFPHMGLSLFYTINFSRPLNGAQDIPDMSWLVHEIMHVVQYKKMGIVYIPRSLWAQVDGGYDYGDLSVKTFAELNLEQQAQLMQYYYINLKHGTEQAQKMQPFVEEMKQIYN